MPEGAVYCRVCGASTRLGGGGGPVLPGYTILARLGQGGAATVYLARQDTLDRRVAVKVINRPVDDPKVWRDFEREARAIARLSGHPNVLAVYTAGRSKDGRPFLVTELVDRGSLADVVERGGPLPPAMVAAVGTAVADALAAAHSGGILHRDVKPGNVLLSSQGDVKLGDFGIAKLVAAQSTTTTGTVAFTPEHVAPEVLRGESEGPWSDVYGLASTLAAAATGASLFVRRPDERVEALLARKLLAPPPSLDGVVPGWLARPLSRALDPDPGRRPDLAELRRQLARGGDGVVHEVRAPMSAVAAARPGRDQPGPDEAPAVRLLGRQPWRRRPHLVPVMVAMMLAIAAVLWLVARGGDDGTATGTAPASADATATSERALTEGATTSGPAPTTARPAPAPTVTSAAPPPADVPVPATTPPPANAAPATLLPAPSASPAGTVASSPANSARSGSRDDGTAAAAPGTQPSATSTPEAQGTITAEQAATFIRSYYDLVAASRYEDSWSRLTPEFQRGKARSYEYYVRFWDENDIEVGQVELVESSAKQATVRVELYWNGSRQPVIDEFVLHIGNDGELLIARQKTIAGGT